MRIEVRIGRHVGDQPMSHARWSRFIADVSALFDRKPSVKGGVGDWEGVREENATIIGTTDRAREILDWLVDIARWYDQDAIAVHTEGAKRWLLIAADGSLTLGHEYELSGKRV